MRLHAENPELSYEEVIELAMRTPIRGYEGKHKYNCRSCGDEMWLDDKDHETREMNKLLGRGFTIPKCGACWA
jgi:hypothetical protein